MMRTRIEAWLLKQLADRMARHANMVELIPKYSLGKSVALDRCEIEEIEKIWKPISSKIDLRYWMVYKGMFPFSALLTPDDIYVRSMVRVLNPMRKCKTRICIRFCIKIFGCLQHGSIVSMVCVMTAATVYCLNRIYIAG